MSIYYTINANKSQKEKKLMRCNNNNDKPLQSLVDDCNLESASKNSPGRDHVFGFAHKFDGDTRAISSGITSFFYCGCERKINPSTGELYTKIYPCKNPLCNGFSCNYCHHRR